MSHETTVREMMKAFGQATPESPVFPGTDVVNGRLRLIAEEFLELIDACGMRMAVGHNNGGEVAHSMDDVTFFQFSRPSIVDIADALADIQVVNTGTAVACGILLEPIVAMVDANNLLKLDGGYLNEAGKFVKPPNHPKPDIAAELQRQVNEAQVSLSLVDTVETFSE